MRGKKNPTKSEKKNLRERERAFFVQEKYAQNGREWQINNKRMKIRIAKIKEAKMEK